MTATFLNVLARIARGTALRFEGGKLAGYCAAFYSRVHIRRRSRDSRDSRESHHSLVRVAWVTDCENGNRWKGGKENAEKYGIRGLDSRGNNLQRRRSPSCRPYGLAERTVRQHRRPESQYTAKRATAQSSHTRDGARQLGAGARDDEKSEQGYSCRWADSNGRWPERDPDQQRWDKNRSVGSHVRRKALHPREHREDRRRHSSTRREGIRSDRQRHQNVRLHVGPEGSERQGCSDKGHRVNSEKRFSSFSSLYSSHTVISDCIRPNMFSRSINK